MHVIRLIRTNMGRYLTVCSCGWQSGVVSKSKAVQAGKKHVKKLGA
jgi:hypothetical protein